MDLIEVKKVIKSLADGVHPITGEVFPDNSPYQHPQIVRALYESVKLIEQFIDRNRKKKNLPENVGKPWDEKEIELLINEFDSGIKVDELSKLHKRTRGAIEARLAKIGKISLTRFNYR